MILRSYTRELIIFQHVCRRRNMTMKKIVYMLLVMGLGFSSMAMAENIRNPEDYTNCSVYDAVYEPPKAEENPPYSFKMHIERNPQGYVLYRRNFFYITKYGRDSKKLSDIRLADDCASWAPNQCGVSIHSGQYGKFSEMRELGLSFNSDIVYLNKDMLQQSEALQEDSVAPYLIFLPHYMNLGGKVEKYRDEWHKYVRFYTEEKSFPDFRGRQVWLFSYCDASGK